MGRLVVVSNRIPGHGTRGGNGGGLAVGLNAALAKRPSLWLGWSGEVAETPPPPERRHSRRTEIVGVALTPALHAGFYAGFANSILWPLFHYRLGLVEYRRADYAAYIEANEWIAAALMHELRPDDTIWVHDYHLIPLAKILRARGVANPIGYFLHIPFPATEVFRCLPVYRDLVEALAHYDLVGFQTESDRVQFVDVLGAPDKRAGDAIEMFGRVFQTGVFPIGIDTQSFAAFAAKPSPDGQRLADNIGDRKLAIGVDRLDYSKGLPNRIAAYGAFLERNPDWRGKVQYLQIAPISRGEVSNYRALRRELDGAAGRINGKYADFDWTPLRYVNRGFPRGTLAAFYRRARVGLVTPLRDGMNLVAKEFVAAQPQDDPGVLILSEFAGAAVELSGALTINPYDVDGIADALQRALEMPLDERVSRWRADFDVISTNTAAFWSESFLSALAAARTA